MVVAVVVGSVAVAVAARAAAVAVAAAGGAATVGTEGTGVIAAAVAMTAVVIATNPLSSIPTWSPSTGFRSDFSRKTGASAPVFLSLLPLLLLLLLLTLRSHDLVPPLFSVSYRTPILTLVEGHT